MDLDSSTLNSISALVREDPPAAERLIERLAQLLRFSLDSHLGLVRLGNELHLVADYLEIEKARFRDRLRFEIEIPVHLHSVEIPALAVQTLVENSVKCAVSPRREGGTVCVTAHEADGAVAVGVSY